MSSPFPPPITPEFRVLSTLRFRASALLNNVLITQTDILDLFCMATAANAAYRVMAAARVRSIEVWAPAAAAGVATVAVEWSGTPGNMTGPKQLITDTTLGSARPAHVKTRAPRDSIAAMWFFDGATGGAIIVLDSPQEAIIDFTCEFIVRNSEGAVAVTAALAAATVGKMYVRRLDSTSSSLLVPIAMDTI